MSVPGPSGPSCFIKNSNPIKVNLCWTISTTNITKVKNNSVDLDTLVTIQNIFIDYLSRWLMFCNFPPFARLNVNSDGPTNGLWFRQLGISSFTNLQAVFPYMQAVFQWRVGGGAGTAGGKRQRREGKDQDHRPGMLNILDTQHTNVLDTLSRLG